MARASSIQLLQYVTAILLVFLVSLHVAERVPWVAEVGYEESLRSEYVSRIYSERSWLLLLLAYTALFHGLNGVRGMLYEWMPGMARLWDTATLALFLLFAGVATYTVVALPPLE